MGENYKEVVRDLYVNIITRGQMDKLAALVADDCFDHGAEASGWSKGGQGFIDHINWLRGCFPDLVIHVEDMVADGDRVVAFWSMAGTHRQEFFGVPPMGRRVDATAISRLRFRDGKLVEYQATFDALGTLQQLGAMPPWPPPTEQTANSEVPVDLSER